MQNSKIHINKNHDINEIKSKVKQSYIEIFKLIAFELRNNKRKEGTESIENEICKQTLELDEHVKIGEATSAGLQKEKFVPQGTVGK